MTLVWTRSAAADLLAIESWIARDRPLAARRVARRIRTRVRLLASLARSGERAAGPAIGEVRRVVVGAYLVFYRIDPDRLVVLRVWDARRPLPDVVGEQAAEYFAARIVRADDGKVWILELWDARRASPERVGEVVAAYL